VTNIQLLLCLPIGYVSIACFNSSWSICAVTCAATFPRSSIVFGRITSSISSLIVPVSHSQGGLVKFWRMCISAHSHPNCCTISFLSTAASLTYSFTLFFNSNTLFFNKLACRLTTLNATSTRASPGWRPCNSKASSRASPMILYVPETLFLLGSLLLGFFLLLLGLWLSGCITDTYSIYQYGILENFVLLTVPSAINPESCRRSMASLMGA